MDTVKFHTLAGDRASLHLNNNNNNSNAEEPAERSITSLTSLARKLGQTYLAADLWVILDMHQKEMSMKDPPTKSQQEQPTDINSPLVLVPRDKRKSNVISPVLSFWVVQEPKAPLYSKNIVGPFLTPSSSTADAASTNLLTFLLELLGREPRAILQDDWKDVAGLVLNEQVLSRDFPNVPTAFTQALTQLMDILARQTKKERDTTGSTSSPRNLHRTADPDSVVSYVEQRMTVLDELHESIVREHRNAGVEAQTFMRKRWVLIQRYIACERARLAQVMANYVHDRVKEGSLQWSFITQVVSSTVRCLSNFRICNPSFKDKKVRAVTALALEEAGVAFWLLRVMDHVFDYCIQESSLSSRLLQELNLAGNYVGTLREYFSSLMWEVNASVALELSIGSARGHDLARSKGKGTKDSGRSFCTPAAVTRMQLSLLAHMNRSVDLCRATLRRVRRVDDGERGSEDRRGVVRDIVAFFRQLNHFFMADMSKLSALFSYHPSADSNVLSNQQTVGDRASVPISAMWILTKMMALDDGRQPIPQDWVDGAIFFHFTTFLMLYAGVKEDPKKMILCKAHLRMLLMLASYRSPLVLDKFFQLRVMHFFVQEISAETFAFSFLPGVMPKSMPVEPVIVPQPDREASPRPDLVPPIIVRATPDVVGPKPEPPKFQVGDRVDGQVTLKSGKQRWFPAKVTAIADDGTLSLLYEDGDSESNKCADHVRHSRSRSLVVPTNQRSPQTRASSADITPSHTPSKSECPNSGNATPTSQASSGHLALPNFLTSPALSLSKHQGEDHLTSAQTSKSQVLDDRLTTGSDADADLVDFDPESDDSDCFDIPPALAPSASRLKTSASLPSMKLPLNDVNMAAARTANADMLSNSLSASLLYGDETTPVESASLMNTTTKRGSSLSLNCSGHSSAYEDAALDLSSSLSLRSSIILEDKYRTQRDRISLYTDPQLHELAILLVLNLCISSDRTSLDGRYCTQFPSSTDNGYENAGSNVLFVLYCHLNHPQNSSVLAPRLRAHVPYFGKAAHRLLRLLCKDMFHAQLYSEQAERIAEGGFGTVVGIRSPVAIGGAPPSHGDNFMRHSADSQLTIKLIGHETSQYDRCVTFDVFSEISALEMLQHSNHICRLYDYGVYDNKFWLVMERCQYNLKTWRLSEMPLEPSDEHVFFYLHIFSKVLEAVHTLHDHNIAHFDLKCDNVFVRMNDGITNLSDGISRMSLGSGSFTMPFSICIGDFGEARIGNMEADNERGEEEEEGVEGKGGLLQARGTEAVQSPEMVRIMAMNRKDTAEYDRRKRKLVGCSSDVWSLG